MDTVTNEALQPDVSFDGGDLDCGNGLLLLIRKRIDPLPRGGLLEIRSTEISVDEDLPAWCRLAGNDLVTWSKEGRQRKFLVWKGKLDERGKSEAPKAAPAPTASVVSDAASPVLARRKEVVPAPSIPALAVMGIGSWPRPRWMIEAMHDYVQGRLDEASFQGTGQ